MRYLTLYALTGVCLLLGACKKELSDPGTPASITLQFTSAVGASPLVLNTSYTDTLGEPFTVTAFRYYISDIKLISKSGGIQSVPGIYHLVDAANTASQTLSFTASVDSLVALSFLIGADSARGVSDIMAELEGTSLVSTAPNDSIEYQIGGFTGQYNVLRTVTLALPSGPYNLLLSESDTLAVSINADINAWFLGPHVLPIAGNPVCTTPGALASEFADNYSMMFTVTNAQIK